MLAELVAEGKIREFGCSNFSAAMLMEAAAATGPGRPGFVSVQNQYNILAREPEDEVLPESASGWAWPSCPTSRWRAGC